MPDLTKLSDDRPVLIAGPTASGKSDLALRIAESSGGIVINADALQVFENWNILTARPSTDDLKRAPHELYGHVAYDFPYSVGHWLRDIEPLLHGRERPIIVGGTGLYFTALTEGLADIPPTPEKIRAQAMAIIEAEGHAALLAEIDEKTRTRIDQNNPMRVQRAWEVARSTGKGLADWQDETPPPLLVPERAHLFNLVSERDWLADRIQRRFDLMLENGVLDEVRDNLKIWDPSLPSAKAIGASELIAFLNGETDLETARDSAVVATLQYAKRQRTWFRSRMKNWNSVHLS